MTETEMTALAAEEGFACASMVGTDKIVFDPSFRPYCQENLCGQYGANYTCPPDCGTPEQMKEKVLSHSKALVLQTIWDISDYADQAAIRQAKSAHNAAQLRLAKKLREAGIPGFLVGASGCALCSPCRRSLGKSCPFPQDRYSCMSAYCIFVRPLTEECRMEYNPGDGLLAFFGMYVFD